MQGIFSIYTPADLKFVKNFTRPDFLCKQFDFLLRKCCLYFVSQKKWKFCVTCWLRSLFRPVLHSIILNLIIFLCKWRDIRKFSCCIFWKRSKVFRIHFFWKWWETRKEAISQIYIIAESTNPWSFCQTSAINKDLSTFTFRMINKGAFFPQTIA